MLSNNGSVASSKCTKTILINPKGKQKAESKLVKRDSNKKKC